jgi:modulator of FtsH protease
MQSVSLGSSGALSPERNRVLRNTYWLLAATMVPTVAGAWFGMSLNLAPLFSGFMGALAFLAIAFVFIFAIQKTRNSGLGVALLLGFTFFMGVLLSGLLGKVLGFKNGAELVALAFGATSAVFFGMAGLATVIKRDLQPLGKMLFVGVILLIVAGLANIFLQSPALMVTLSVIAAGIFSLYLLVDLKAVRDGHETNYVSATLGLYLSLFNLFQNLLSLLGIFGGED